MHTTIKRALCFRNLLTMSLCCVAMAILPAGASAREPLAIMAADGSVVATRYENLAQSGWFALLDAGESRLEPTQFVLKRKGRLNPADFGEEYDLWTSSHTSASTLYFLRHASMKSGPVAQAKLSDYAEISNEGGVAGLVLAFKGKSYSFDVERLDSAKPELRRIAIKTDGGRSWLYDWRQHSGSAGENRELVRWAGDLDRDGRLDLIIEFSTYFNSATCLFLSGSVQPPKLMKRIGCWFVSA